MNYNITDADDSTRATCLTLTLPLCCSSLLSFLNNLHPEQGADQHELWHAFPKSGRTTHNKWACQDWNARLWLLLLFTDSCCVCCGGGREPKCSTTISCPSEEARCHLFSDQCTVPGADGGVGSLFIFMCRLNSVKNTNFGLDNKKSFLTHSKIVFGVTDNFCIKWTFWKNDFFCPKNAFFWQQDRNDQ